MKKIIIVCLFMLCLFVTVQAEGEIASSGSEGVPDDWVIKDTYGPATLYQVGEFNLVRLRGNYLEMGKQYGALLKNDIHKLYKNMVVKGELGKGVSKEELDRLLSKSWTGLPKRIKDILTGISQTSELPLKDLVALDCYRAVGYRFINKIFPEEGCSYIAAWDSYTLDGRLYNGRLYDWAAFKDYGEFVTVVIFEPDDGSHKVANITYAGWVGIITVLNDAGLYMEENIGAPTMGSTFYSNRVDAHHSLLEFMFDCNTMQGLEYAINSYRTPVALIIGAADSEEAWVFEDAPFEVKKRGPSKPGLIAAANQYMLDWGIMKVEDPSYSLLRYDNLVKLGNKYKGKIDPEVMMKIVETPVAKDGKPAGGAMNPYTAHMEVCDVANRIFWIKAPDHAGWTKIDLSGILVPAQD